MSNLKKFLTIGVTVMTVLWSVGVSLAPLGAGAAASAGDLIKMAGNSAVYYFDGSKRYVFPNESTYKSWYKDFSGVKTVPASELQSYAIGGNVTIRPGTKLVKITTDPKVYAISHGGTLHGIDSEARALKLYGSNWNKMIVDVSDAFFVNYKTGAAISSDVHVNGTLVKYSGSSTYYLVEDGKKRPFASDAALAANMIDTANAIVTDVTYSDGTSITGKESTLTNVAGSSTPGQVVTGDVTVGLSSTSPASSTLVTGQITAPLGAFTFTGTATITGLTFYRTGVSADTTLSNVYLFDGPTRLTDAATVSSNGAINFTASAGLFSVAGSKTITVKSDIATSTSGQTVGVALNSAADIKGANVSGSFPVSSSLHTIASATLADITFGTVTPSGGSIDPANDVTVWQSTVTVSQRDVKLSRFALRQVGSVNNTDINNFRLLVDGVQVATASALDSNGYVTFVLSPEKTLVTGGRTFKVLADVLSGSSRTFQFSLRQKSDVEALDSSYNVNVGSTTSFPVAPSSATTITEGQVTVQKASDSASGDATLNASDVTLGKFTFTAYGEPIKVETLRANFTHSANNATALRNGRIMVNGSQVGSTTNLAEDSAGTPYTSYTTNFIVTPGTPATVEVRADLYASSGTALAASQTVTANVYIGSSNATKQVSLGSINVPTATVTGNALTMRTGASLTMAAATTYPAQTTTIPQTAYLLAEYNLTGSTTEDVNLDTVSVDFTAGAGDFTYADLTDVYLTVDGTQSTIKGTVAATGNSWSISKVLVKNSTIKVKIYGNIGSSITPGSTATITSSTTISGTTASSAVTSTTGAVTGQVITAGTGSLTATKDASSPDAKLLDDVGTVNVAAFKFASVNDGYTVTDVTVTIPAATTIQNVILKDGATTLATKPGAASVAFSGLSWSVPANANKVLSVDLQLASVGVGAGTSGETVTVSLSAATARNSQGVSAAVSGLGSAVAANAMYVYKAIPTITNVALNSLLGTGTQTLAKFSVNTNGTGTIGWKKLIFTVTKTGGAADDPAITSSTLWDADTNTQITGTATEATVGALNSSGTITFVATDEQQISGAKTYELRATVTATLATGDNINTSIAQPVTYVAPAAYATVAGTAASFVWTDQSASSHSATTLDWNNGYLVKNLPTNTQTLTK
ncbi:MAG: beta strand repeat-containing protein [Patescibacteria group bacterium]